MRIFSLTAVATVLLLVGAASASAQAGRYRLRVIARNSAGQSSKPATAAFRIV